MNADGARMGVPNDFGQALGGSLLESTLQRSLAHILTNQSQNGAFVASPDFDQYHFCWLRDGSFIAYALDRAGQNYASSRYHSWVNDTVESISGIIDDVVERQVRGEVMDPSLMPPARFALDGTSVVDDWPNFQIDGYGTWLWSLGQHFAMTGEGKLPVEFRDSVARVGRYLATFALSPCYDVWEENGTAVHTSTLASVFGGLIAASQMLDDQSLLRRAEELRTRMVQGASSLGLYVKSTENDDVDASVLWLLAPFHVVSQSDANFARTVDTIESRLTFEGGIRRYASDVYFGSGAWPVLTASLGWHKLTTGDVEGARRCRDWVGAHFDEMGRLGEQFGGERRDPKHYLDWLERWGPPAQDLTWSHAMFVILLLAIEDVERDVGEPSSRSSDGDAMTNDEGHS